jgi:Adenylate and Guanylate cyclase catalytic domain
LLNILPKEIADELKTSGQATPRLYESATVLFSDFVNFTKLSSTLTPKELIDELNECFLALMKSPNDTVWKRSRPSVMPICVRGGCLCRTKPTQQMPSELVWKCEPDS